MYDLDLLIKIHTNDKELKFMPKRIKSKLPIYRIAFIKNWDILFFKIEQCQI